MDSAQAMYKLAVEIMDIPVFNFLLGWSYYHDDQFVEALVHLEKAYNYDKNPITSSVAYL